MIYNLTLVLKSTLKDTEKKDLLKKVKELFGKAKITEKDLGQKALAYPIEKQVSGVYINMIIESEIALGKDIDNKLNKEPSIIRYLFIRNK